MIIQSSCTSRCTELFTRDCSLLQVSSLSLSLSLSFDQWFWVLDGQVHETRSSVIIETTRGILLVLHPLRFSPSFFFLFFESEEVLFEDFAKLGSRGERIFLNFLFWRFQRSKKKQKRHLCKTRGTLMIQSSCMYKCVETCNLNLNQFIFVSCKYYIYLFKLINSCFSFVISWPCANSISQNKLVVKGLNDINIVI